jgi:hypothetical protein
MSVTAQIKKSLIGILPDQVTHFLRNQISLANIPHQKKSVISDLFSFRITNGWETHFELLNVPALIDPKHNVSSSYLVKFLFFDEVGNLIHEWEKENTGCSRQSIRLNDILEGKSVSGYGTFACFHKSYMPHLIEQGGFLAERGYTGYSNTNISKVKGYVHGNLDALAMNEYGELFCLGKSFRFQKHEYRLQHQLEGPATYELGIVNTTNAGQDVIIEVLSDNQETRTEKKFIPSKGVVWFSYTIKENELARVVIHSKINLPRPVVFRSAEKSFDVFHG